MHASIHFARQLASRIFISLQEIQVNDHIDNFSALENDIIWKYTYC